MNSVLPKIIEVMRVIIDISTYWSQLVILVAIAFERYIVIVRATESASILNKTNRVRFYIMTFIVSVSVPTLASIDILANTDWNQVVFEVCILSAMTSSRQIRPIFRPCFQSKTQIFICVDIFENQLKHAALLSRKHTNNIPNLSNKQYHEV